MLISGRNCCAQSASSVIEGVRHVVDGVGAGGNRKR